MRRGARFFVSAALVVAAGVGCSAIAGIEDLQLTGSPDASGDGAPNDATMESSGTGDSGGESGEASTCTGGQTRCSGTSVETCQSGHWGAPSACPSGSCSAGACAGSCTAGQVQCSGNGVQACDNGQWGTPLACSNQTCVGGVCTGLCAPSQTNPVPCGKCGTDTQTCSATGTWKPSGTCSNQGACAPGGAQACNSYGMQTCTSTCAWGSCSCNSAPVCTPTATQCSGTDVQACGGCGQWGPPTPCTSGTCMGGVCKGACTTGDMQCSGNGVETCVGGMWGSPVACVSQTCVGMACTGVCAPGQTNPVTCGKCGTDTETCSASGAWQSSGTCSGQGACTPTNTQPCNTYGTETCISTCSWGACSCPPSPVCTPGAQQCSGGEVQTCSACGQWGSPAPCGSHQTCSGGACVGTDCPGSFLLCDGFESGPPVNTSRWSDVAPDQVGKFTIAVDGTNPHTGSYSLHFQVNAVGGGPYLQANIGEDTTFASTPVFIRAWYWLSKLPGPDNDVLIGIASNANTQSASGQFGFYSTGQLGNGVANTIPTSDNYGNTSSTLMPLGAWTCLELELDTSYAAPNPSGLWKVWKDTDSVANNLTDLTGTAELQTLAAASFGIDLSPPIANAFDLYVDDIAISNSFIPCSQ